jgi:hypothetical protein
MSFLERDQSAFWREFIPPVEDRLRSDLWCGDQGRWFRAKNVIDLWIYRSDRDR